MTTAQRILLSSLALALAGACGPAPASDRDAGTIACRPLGALGHETLYDFNDNSPAAREKIAIVEANHFTPEVQALQKGRTSSVQNDLDFVLRAIPNHYRALYTMARWQVSTKFRGDREGRVEPADCYFKRALEFRPADGNLSVAYGVYLHQVGRYDEALRQYERAESLGVVSPELDYNLGLLWYDRGELAKAQQYADRAYAAGYPLPGLRNKLRSARQR